MPGAIGDVQGVAPPASEEEESPMDPVPGVDRLPLKRKAVPLLPSLTDDQGSWTALEEKMKRVKEMMDSTISLKPAKLARYDQHPEMKGSPSPEQNKTMLRRSGSSGSSIGLRHNFSDGSILGMSLSAFNVIPLNELRMGERHTPLDVKAFLSRVGTFDLRMWSAKPHRLCAFQCARFGWRVAGKNTLLCVSCRNLLSIPHDQGCSNLDEWTTCIEQQIQKTAHMSDCIWVRSPSPTNILLLPEGNDMQTYMREAALSFTRMRSLPVLTERYRLIMDVLEMHGFKERTGLQLTQVIEGNSKELIEQCAAFLMLNGWTMDDMDINALQCASCLRQVPLWLCLPTPTPETQNACQMFAKCLPTLYSTQSVHSSVNSLSRKLESNVKELDPIASHWFWCPWRKMLQRSDPDQRVEAFLQVESTNIYDDENLAYVDIIPSVDAYMILAVKLDADFKRGRLVRGRQSLEMSDNSIAISTIRSFKELLNALQSGNNTPSYVPVGDTILPSDMKNELVSIKLSEAKVLCEKLLQSTPETGTSEVPAEQPALIPQLIDVHSNNDSLLPVVSNIAQPPVRVVSEELSPSQDTEDTAVKEAKQNRMDIQNNGDALFAVSNIVHSPEPIVSEKLSRSYSQNEEDTTAKIAEQDHHNEVVGGAQENVDQSLPIISDETPIPDGSNDVMHGIINQTEQNEHAITVDSELKSVDHSVDDYVEDSSAQDPATGEPENMKNAEILANENIQCTDGDEFQEDSEQRQLQRQYNSEVQVKHNEYDSGVVKVDDPGKIECGENIPKEIECMEGDELQQSENTMLDDQENDSNPVQEDNLDATAEEINQLDKENATSAVSDQVSDLPNTAVTYNIESEAVNPEGVSISSEVDIDYSNNQSLRDMPALDPVKDVDNVEDSGSSNEFAIMPKEGRTQPSNSQIEGEQAQLEQDPDDDENNHSDYSDDDENDYDDDNDDDGEEYPEDEMPDYDSSPPAGRGEESFNSSNQSDSDDDIVCLD